MVAVGGLAAVAPLLASVDPPALHEPGKAMAPMSPPARTEFARDAGGAGGLTAFRMDVGDLFRQCLILLETGSGRFASAVPVVEPTGRDLEVRAAPRDGMVGSQRVNPFEAFRDGSERRPNVFF